MSNEFTVDDGAFLGKLAESFVELTVEADNGLTNKANDVVKRAQQLVPVETGRLAAAIMATPIQHELTGPAIEVGVDKQAFYGFMVEYGTSLTPPRPFLRPALEEATRGGFDVAPGGLSGG